MLFQFWAFGGFSFTNESSCPSFPLVQGWRRHSFHFMVPIISPSESSALTHTKTLLPLKEKVIICFIVSDVGLSLISDNVCEWSPGSLLPCYPHATSSHRWCSHLSLRMFSDVLVSGKECGQPGEPAHGSLMSTEILFYPGEEVTYSCNQGFVLTGSERRMCGEDGNWSGALPACSMCLVSTKTRCHILSSPCSRGELGRGSAHHPVWRAVELRAGAGRGRGPQHLQLHN